MATTKVSALSAKTSLAGSEELLINDSGTSKKVTATNLLAGVSVADGSISTAKIADDAVTADKLANSINTDIATGVTANTTANAALPKAGGTMTGELDANAGITTSTPAGDNNFPLSAYHPTSTAARTIARFQSNVGSTEATVASITAGGKITATELDVSGAIDVDAITHLDVVDIDGAVDMASTLTLAGNADFNNHLDVAGNITVNGTVDGIDIATRDAVLTSTTTTADAALPKAGGTMTGTLAMAHASISGNVTTADNTLIQLGAGNDLILTHNGSNSQIKNLTGNLEILSDGLINMQDAGANETFAIFNDNGAVVLYHDNSAKIATTATGISVTGTAVATTNTDATNTGSVTLDFAANQNFVLTLTGNVTLANPSTEQVGQSGFITFIQDGTGGRTVALGTDYETAGGAGLTLTSTASATDIVPYVVVASGRILLGTPQLAFA